MIGISCGSLNLSQQKNKKWPWHANLTYKRTNEDDKMLIYNLRIILAPKITWGSNWNIIQANLSTSMNTTNNDEANKCITNHRQAKWDK